MKVGKIYIKKDGSVIAKFLGYGVYASGVQIARQGYTRLYSEIGYVHKLKVISKGGAQESAISKFIGYDNFIIVDESEWEEV